MQPEKGTFEIETVGQKRKIPNKKDTNNPWTSWGLQFKGDPQWYDTFWLQKEDPVKGQKLNGTKSYDEKWDSYKFDVERQGGGKGNWNPAGAQATIVGSAVAAVNGFLLLPGHYEMWSHPDVDTGDGKNSAKLKKLFALYLATVDSTVEHLKQKAIQMGSLQAEQKVAETKQQDSGDPGPTPPPDIEEIPGDEIPQEL